MRGNIEPTTQKSNESPKDEMQRQTRDSEIVVYDSDAGTDTTEDEGTELPSPTLGTSLPPIDADLSPCAGSTCLDYNRPFGQIARNRARDSFTRQREFIMDTVETIRKDGSIHSKASDLAAQRLHVFASQIAEDGLVDDISEHEPLKKVLRHLFPVF